MSVLADKLRRRFSKSEYAASEPSKQDKVKRSGSIMAVFGRKKKQIESDGPTLTRAQKYSKMIDDYAGGDQVDPLVAWQQQHQI
jgi:hypothetical protein